LVLNIKGKINKIAIKKNIFPKYLGVLGCVILPDANLELLGCVILPDANLELLDCA
jgi:hypothetical protein